MHHLILYSLVFNLIFKFRYFLLVTFFNVKYFLFHIVNGELSWIASYMENLG